jgi:hypothetical protein
MGLRVRRARPQTHMSMSGTGTLRPLLCPGISATSIVMSWPNLLLHILHSDALWEPSGSLSTLRDSWRARRSSGGPYLSIDRNVARRSALVWASPILRSTSSYRLYRRNKLSVAAKPIERTSITLRHVPIVDTLVYSANRKTTNRTRTKLRPQPEANKRLL